MSKVENLVNNFKKCVSVNLTVLDSIKNSSYRIVADKVCDCFKVVVCNYCINKIFKYINDSLTRSALAYKVPINIVKLNAKFSKNCVNNRNNVVT